MALIKLGAFVTEVSGKVGGSIFSRNKGGAYVKNRVVPLNPDTNFQSAVRAIFASISQAWSGLTQNQITAWNNAVGDFPYQNRLGEKKTLSGKALFQRLNDNLLNIGESLITDVPAPDAPSSVIASNEAPVFDIGTGDAFSFELQLSESTSNAKAVLECTAPLTPGTNNANNRFRKLAVSSALSAATTVDEEDFAATAADLVDAYEARFGTPAVGEKVKFRVKIVSTNSGQAGQYWTEDVIVSDT